MFDIAIVGAGINGCSVAYEFRDKKVLLLDKDGIADGGSGAAGAFVSPKFSKAGELKELLHVAFLYSFEFYQKHFDTFTTKAPLIHIAKDEKDDEILSFYKQHTTLPLLHVDEKTLQNLNIQNREFISIHSLVVDAKGVCKELAKNAEFKKHEVKKLTFFDEYVQIDDKFKAKKIVLATGAYKYILDEEHIKLRGIWGHRIDIKTSTNLKNFLHQNVSISKTKDGIISIGATHNVHYHPQTSKEPYNLADGQKELLEKANKTITLKDVEIVKNYIGLRSGSFDYIPLLGKVVNSAQTLTKDIKFKTKKPNYKDYTYYKNLYMINGNGGYGFVLAPYLAKLLKDEIQNKKEIDKNLQPARFFYRWAKKI